MLRQSVEWFCVQLIRNIFYFTVGDFSLQDFFPKEREEILAASLARDFQIKDDFNQRIVATAMRRLSVSQSVQEFYNI